MTLLQYFLVNVHRLNGCYDYAVLLTAIAVLTLFLLCLVAIVCSAQTAISLKGAVGRLWLAIIERSFQEQSTYLILLSLEFSGLDLVVFGIEF